MHDARMPTRLRRKCVRFSGGSANSRRIWSRNASSLSFLRASRAAFRDGLRFRKRRLQNPQHGQIPRPASGLLALDDIRQSGDVQGGSAEPDHPGAFAQALERPDAVDGRHKVQLQPIAVPRHPQQPADRILGLQDHRFEVRRQRLQLLPIRRCPAIQEVEIDGGDGSALQRAAFPINTASSPWRASSSAMRARTGAASMGDQPHGSTTVPGGYASGLGGTTSRSASRMFTHHSMPMPLPQAG